MAEDQGLSGPNLAADGIADADLGDGTIVRGHDGETNVVMVRSGDEVMALGGSCTHYGGPLADGLFDGTGIRCPWHHACFDARTGLPLRPPALDPVAIYDVQQRDGRWYATSPRTSERTPPPPPQAPDSVVVVVGAGAAGAAAAETLRDEGYAGPVTLITADGADPVDRPNLSKDYLAGEAPEAWIPLRSPEFYAERGITLLRNRTVASVDPGSRAVALDDGTEIPFEALLLATGAEPIRQGCSSCAPAATPRRSWRRPRRPSGRWSSAPASSGWRPPPRCATGASR
jgi:nitrite reductase/ring-hydroxylating ferredoxin subunit